MNFQKSRKAQVTLFVIIGIVLLIAVVLFLLLRERTVVIHDTGGPASPVVEKKYAPIQNFVQDCLYTVSNQALDLLGQEGGYINPLGPKSDTSLMYDKSALLDSDGVLLSSQKSSFVPYWFYSVAPVSSDSIEPKFSVPPLDDIQRRHENYVNENLLHCIDNFSSLDYDGGTITILDDPKTEITYTDTSTLIKTTLPLEIKSSDGVSKNLDVFVAEIPIAFKKYYEKAYTIAVAEFSDQFLENALYGFISLYGRADSASLPPFFWQNSKQSVALWNQVTVNYRLQELLSSYIPLFRIAGTKNGDLIPTKNIGIYERPFYNNFNLPLFVLNNSELDISFMYLNWPIYSHVSPSAGGVIQPGSYNPADGFVFMTPQKNNLYQFFYDVSYPVVVEIHEDNIKGAGDYTFMFALEGNIRNNLNWIDYAQGRGPLDWDPSWISLQVPSSSKTVYDLATQKEYLQENQLNPAKKLFNDPEQYLSGNISLSTYDDYTHQPLDGVQISIGSGSYALANIGYTTFNEEKQLATFTGKMPLVYNGYLKLQKEGYLPYTEPITLKPNEDVFLGHKQLIKKQVKNISVRILDLNQTPPVYRKPYDYEDYFLTLKKITTPLDSSTFNQVVMKKGNESTTHIELVPGRFSISGMLIDNQGIIIPAKCQRICSGMDCLFVSKDDKYIPPDPVSMQPAMWGGINLNASAPWLLSVDNAYNITSNITFTILKLPEPTCLDSLKLLGELPELSLAKRSMILPVVE